MRILIVEDEKKTAAYLHQGLTEHGFSVDLCHDGEEGLHAARSTHYDCIVLDVMLPTMDGWTILQHLRTDGTHVPVLMLTARDAVSDRVHGLTLGADDYLLKPFAFSELLARLRSIVRRSAPRELSVLNVADLQLAIAQRKASRSGKPLDLTPREFALLELLVRHQTEPVSRTFIAERVWDVHFAYDTNVIDVAIRRLRRKVDDPFSTKLIHTVRGVGYVLEERT